MSRGVGQHGSSRCLREAKNVGSNPTAPSPPIPAQTLGNPVPEVALVYVLDYLQVLLEKLLEPQDDIDGAALSYVCERTGIPRDIAVVLQHLLAKRGLTVTRVMSRLPARGSIVWFRLTAHGYLKTLELLRQWG